jgi:hypothetical protein
MVRISLDSSVASQLIPLVEGAELCDPSGNVLGYFTPVASASSYGQVEVPYTEEELQRIEQQPGGRQLDAILRDLAKEP